MYMQKDRWLLSSLSLAHFFVLGLKKFSPHNLVGKINIKVNTLLL